MSCCVLEQEWPTVTLWMQEESQILHPCRRPGEMGPKASGRITAEPLQVRDSLVKGDLRVPTDPHRSIGQTPGWKRSSPFWSGTAHGGFPGNALARPISCCARLEEHLGHHCHPENHTLTVFGSQHIKVRVLSCPAGGFISVLGFLAFLQL